MFPATTLRQAVAFKSCSVGTYTFVKKMSHKPVLSSCCCGTYFRGFVLCGCCCCISASLDQFGHSPRILSNHLITESCLEIFLFMLIMSTWARALLRLSLPAGHLACLPVGSCSLTVTMTMLFYFTLLPVFMCPLLILSVQLQHFWSIY